MHRYHLVKAEADDHMPDKAASGLVPLKSWFSLDLAAHQDKDDAEEEVEADLHSGAPSRAMLPSRLPRLWSSHRGVGKSRSTDDDVQSEQVPSTAPAESDSKQARSTEIFGSRPSTPMGSEQGSGYFTVEREHISQARILPVEPMPNRTWTRTAGKERSAAVRSVSPERSGSAKHGGHKSIWQGSHGAAWHAVMLLSCGVAFLSYLDRAIMGVTILPMAAEKGYSKSMEGFISSTFFLGYTLTNIGAGYMADRFSSKAVLEVGVWTWSLFTMLTPVAARSGIWPLLLARFLTGIGEGVTFPGLQMIISNCVDDDCNSRAISFVYSGATFGAVTAYLSAPFIVERWGWPAVFTVYGLIGFIWVVMWSMLVSERPSHRQVSLLQAREPNEAPTRIPYRAFATYLPLWAIIIVETSHGIGQYVAFFWQPTYYVEVYSGALQNSSLYSTLPWVASAVCTNVAGWVADALIARSALTLTAVRKLMEGVSCFGAAACLLLMAFLPKGRSVWVAVGLFTAMQSFAGCHVSGAACQHLDINARYAAAMYGLTTALSTILEAGGIAGTGYILESRHSWGLLFVVVAVLHIFGGTVYVCFSDSKARFHEGSPDAYEKMAP